MSISLSLVDSDRTAGHQHRTYDVTIDGVTVRTVVAKGLRVVSEWIRETDSLTINERGNDKSVNVAIDIESRPSFNPSQPNPAAIIQFCIGNRCLIFQFLQRFDREYSNLQRFIGESGYTFVGVDLVSVLDNLLTHWNLDVWNTAELRKEAAAVEPTEDYLKNADVMRLAGRFMDVKIEKPRWIESSDMDREWLSDEQVKYAVADVHVAYRLSKVLEALIADLKKGKKLSL